MGNDARKWIPLGLIAVTVAATAFLVRDLPSPVAIDLRSLLPFSLEPTGDSAPRWVTIVGMPAIAAVVWAMFQIGRGAAGMRLARAIFRDMPQALGDPATIERIRATYDTIALWIVVMVLGVHAGMIAAALGHEALAPRLIGLVMGISIAAAGNVMPRLRPNLLAGVRTRRTLTDPELWRATHRILGVAFVVAGIIIAAVGLIAPAYALIATIVTLILALLVAAIGGGRARRAAAAFVLAFALLGRDTAAQGAVAAPIVVPPAPAHVIEERFSVDRPGLTLEGTLAMPRDRAAAVPVVLMIAGSGATDRNGNGPMVHTNAYAQLAWALAEAGFATVRYDKRGIAASASRNGDPTTLLPDHYVADAMEFARTIGADTRFSSVYLLGHSEGAGHVLQAANRGASVAGVILVSGTGRPLAEVLHDQFSRQVDSATVTKIDSAFARYLRGEDPGDVPPIATPVMVPAYRNFMRAWAAYDPETEAKRLRSPLLIIQGTTDVQISMVDAMRLGAAQPSATLVKLEGVNHVLKSVPTTDLKTQLASYRNPELPLAPGVVEAIVRWASVR